MYEEEKNQTGLEKNDQRTSYDEEMANELAQVVSVDQSYTNDDEPARDGKIANTNKGTWLGIASLIVGIIALFTSPVLFGIIAIILGFIARKSGSTTAGSWGIVLGAVSIIFGIMLIPFF
ncbi:DUF4190 domain-containing protein [Jeotgalibacillus sp. S-D1]|uniref:DUF4190 domain-containing protein n=1 Tax=Jeotgalibacillus sp. S-D1 TaxID=2552189 RepID=UPI0010597694|nr:DUF4190 domain-containing protein [Jeotgalibacillus sp. S-D1]TDL34530.1 DUF4190 domain-containing protein [Jeotgalibacillus sp. S-D1]